MSWDISKWAFLILMIAVLIEESKSIPNILIGKPVILDTVNDASRAYMNDGNNNTCTNFDGTSPQIIVYDLMDIYRINRITVNNRNYRATQPAYFYLGNKFRGCNFYKLIKDYSTCDPFNQNSATNTVSCNSGSGRYFVLMKGNPFTPDVFEPLNVCELVVDGDLIGSVAELQRPVITNSTLPQIDKSYFKIIPEIRANVPFVTIPMYASGMIYINNNCEPIVYDSVTSLPFGVACKTPDGQGRMVAFARGSFVKGLYTDPSSTQFLSNIQKWMSPRLSNAPYVLSSNFQKPADFSKLIPGHIVLFDMYTACPDNVLQLWKSFLLNGTISMVFDITFWSVSNTPAGRVSYLKLLSIFNVDYVNTFITWSSTMQSPMDDSVYGDQLLNLEDKLKRMSLNHDYLLSMGSMFADLFNSYSLDILRNSNAKQYIMDIVTKYSKLLEWICPCQIQPVTDANDKIIIRILGDIMKSQLLAGSNIRAPCVEIFPGDFTTPPSKSVVTLSLTGVTEATQNPIGYYLRAGETLSYTVSQSTGVWGMSVGCHTDNLPDTLSGWSRYPDIYISNIQLSNTGQIFSPFGGVLWLMNDVIGATMTITLSNVIASPFFNLRDPNTATKWETEKLKPGIWSQIAADTIVFCESTSKLTGYSGAYVKDLMSNIWDKVVRMEALMFNYDLATLRPQSLVLDVQLNLGYGHSGYPIVVYYDWNSIIFNKTNILKTGSWGMCHEIGHNLQRSKWTFTGTDEVTNNILCLFIYDKLLKLPRQGTNISYVDVQALTDYLDNGAKFSDWQADPWTALSLYIQLVNNLGWGFFKKVFEYYEINNINPTSDSDKMTTFINITSIIAKQNLIPIFDYWGFSIDSNLAGALSTLPCYFPADDFQSNLSMRRTQYIKSTYPNCNSKTTFLLDYSADPFISGVRRNFIQELSAMQM